MAESAGQGQASGPVQGQEQQVGWPLVFKPLESYPIIGKFDDKVNLAAAKKPLRMYLKEEEIIEEMFEHPTNQTEKYNRSKIKPRRYRPKSELHIEDSTHRKPNGPPVGLQYEGRITNLDFQDVEEPNQSKSSKTTFKGASSSSADNSFKYVLLEFAKGDSGSTEVNMIPVGDWFTFKKPSVTGQKMLDQVDEDFELKLQRDKARLSKYKRIAESLEAHSGPKTDKSAGHDEEDISAPAAFGRAVSKAIRKGIIGRGLNRQHMNEGGIVRIIDIVC
jgi:hypothetical protein